MFFNTLFENAETIPNHDKQLLLILNTEESSLNRSLIKPIIKNYKPTEQIIKTVNKNPNSQLALGVGKNPNLDISQVIETVKDIPDSWLALGVGENPHAQYRYFLQIHNLYLFFSLSFYTHFSSLIPLIIIVKLIFHHRNLYSITTILKNKPPLFFLW